MCCFSFLPKTDLQLIISITDNSARNRRNSLNDSDNLYYFGDLLKYKNDELLDSIKKFYFNNDENNQLNHSKEHLDIAQQIIVNSQIAFDKFKIFTCSLHCFIISIIIFIVSLVIHAINNIF